MNINGFIRGIRSVFLRCHNFGTHIVMNILSRIKYFIERGYCLFCHYIATSFVIFIPKLFSHGGLHLLVALMLLVGISYYFHKEQVEPIFEKRTLEIDFGCDSVYLNMVVFPDIKCVDSTDLFDDNELIGAVMFQGNYKNTHNYGNMQLKISTQNKLEGYLLEGDSSLPKDEFHHIPIQFLQCGTEYKDVFGNKNVVDSCSERCLALQIYGEEDTWGDSIFSYFSQIRGEIIPNWNVPYGCYEIKIKGAKISPNSLIQIWYADSLPINIVNAYPLPEISMKESKSLKYEGEVLEQVIDNGGLTIWFENWELKEQYSNKEFSMSVWLGVAIGFLLDVIVQIVIKWRNLVRREQKREREL